jgi:hypothetical protein
VLWVPRLRDRAPTGYDMVNGELVRNEMAPLVVRVFELRAARKSHPGHRGRGRLKVLDRSPHL